MMIPLNLRPMRQNGLKRNCRAILGTDVGFLFSIAFHYSVRVLCEGQGAPRAGGLHPARTGYARYRSQTPPRNWHRQ